MNLGGDPGGWLVAALGAIATFVVGLISGRAQIVSAASKAADMIIAREGEIIQRQEAVIRRLEAEHETCRAALAELREVVAEMRLRQGLPAYEFKAPSPGPAAQGEGI